MVLKFMLCIFYCKTKLCIPSDQPIPLLEIYTKKQIRQVHNSLHHSRVSNETVKKANRGTEEMNKDRGMRSPLQPLKQQCACTPTDTMNMIYLNDYQVVCRRFPFGQKGKHICVFIRKLEGHTLPLPFFPFLLTFFLRSDTMT